MTARRTSSRSRRPAPTSWPTWLRTPPDVVPPPRDELVIKVLVAMRVPGVDVPELLQVHRRHLVEAMQEYTHLKEEIAEGEVELALVVDSELFRHRGDRALARRRGRPAEVPGRTAATRRPRRPRGRPRASGGRR